MVAITKPKNAFMFLTERLPDQFIFPAWVCLFYSALVLALFAAPDFSGIKRSVQRATGSSAASEHGFGTAERLFIFVCVTLLAILCIVSLVFQEGVEICCPRCRLNEADSTRIL